MKTTLLIKNFKKMLKKQAKVWEEYGKKCKKTLKIPQKMQKEKNPVLKHIKDKNGNIITSQ